MNTAETVVVGQIHHPTHEVIVAQAAVRGTQGARIEYPQGGCQAQLGLPAAAPEVEETLRRNDSAVDDGRGRQALGAERAHDEIREPRAGGAAGETFGALSRQALAEDFSGGDEITALFAHQASGGREHGRTAGRTRQGRSFRRTVVGEETRQRAGKFQHREGHTDIGGAFARGGVVEECPAEKQALEFNAGTLEKSGGQAAVESARKKDDGLRSPAR